jgi:hypothetical protein
MVKELTIDVIETPEIDELLGSEDALALEDIQGAAPEMNLSLLQEDLLKVDPSEIVDLSDLDGMEEFQSEDIKLKRKKGFVPFQTKNILLNISTELEIARDGDHYQIGPDAVYYDREQMLQFHDNFFKLPLNSVLSIESNQLGLTTYFYGEEEELENFMVFRYDRGHLTAINQGYFVTLAEKTKVFIDDKSSLAFDYCGDVAVINFGQKKLEICGFKIELGAEQKHLKIGKKGIQLEYSCRLIPQKGLILLGKNKLKVPKDTVLKTTGFGVVLTQKNDDDSASIYAFLQGKQLNLRSEDISIRMGRNAQISLDKKGNIVFSYQEELGIINFSKKKMKLFGRMVRLYRGQNLKINGKWVNLSDFVRLHPEKNILKIGQSKMQLSSSTVIGMDPDQVRLNVNDKLITVIPRNKQIFINVGGRLVILTVTVGIALDQKGNLAFDYKGHLMILDTKFFVLNVSGTRLNLGQIPSASVEIIGKNIFVASRQETDNIMTNFTSLLNECGIDRKLIEDLGITTEDELFEWLLTISSKEKMMKTVAQFGTGSSQDFMGLFSSLMNVGSWMEGLGQSGEGEGESLLWMTMSEGNGLNANIAGSQIDLATVGLQGKEMMAQASGQAFKVMLGMADVSVEPVTAEGILPAATL